MIEKELRRAVKAVKQDDILSNTERFITDGLGTLLTYPYKLYRSYDWQRGQNSPRRRATGRQ